MVLKVPQATTLIGETTGVAPPTIDHDVAIIAYQGDSPNAASSVGAVSPAFHSVAEVSAWLGSDGPGHQTAAALFAYDRHPRSIHVLSLGAAGTPVASGDGSGAFQELLSNLAATPEGTSPDLILMPGIAHLSGGGTPTTAYTNILTTGTYTASGADGYYADLQAYCVRNKVMGFASFPGGTARGGVALSFLANNANTNVLLCGNRSRVGSTSDPYRDSVGAIVGAIINRELDDLYGVAGGIHYARVVGVSGVEWDLEHNIRNASGQTANILNADGTIIARDGSRFHLLGGTLGGYDTTDYRGYFSVSRSILMLERIVDETVTQFIGQKDDGSLLARAKQAIEQALDPLVPSVFAGYNIVPTNFASDGRLSYQGTVDIFIPAINITVRFNLRAATFEAIAN